MQVRGMKWEDGSGADQQPPLRYVGAHSPFDRLKANGRQTSFGRVNNYFLILGSSAGLT